MELTVTHNRNETTSGIKSDGDNKLFWETSRVTREDRENRNKHRGYIIWLTGLSGAGKSTIAQELERILFSRGYQIRILDGDNVRQGLNSDLGFSADDRQENIRRIGEVSKLFAETGIITISAFISPYTRDRERIRGIMPPGDFIEVYVECSLAECERRDTKGLYKKARAGLIKNFTGIDDPFEPPANPELIVNTENSTVTESVSVVLSYLNKHGHL
nr:adenylyl-sulfate kinase [candidate division Zixibacteria bacterium]